MIRVLPGSILVRLIQESLDAVLIIDAESRIRYANPAMENLCGYRADELINESLNRLLPSDTAHKHDEYIRKYLERGASAVLGRVRELNVLHRDGELIPVDLKAVDLGEAAGVRYFGAFMTDVRLRKAVEADNVALMTQLEQQALTDALTGLPNRRAFDLEAARAMAFARRQQWPIVIGMMDIDWFKRINDRYGHLTGDNVLRAVAATIQKCVRSGDLCGRIGGDEFVLLLSHASLEQAQAIAERVRAELAEQPVAALGIDAPIGVSIGLAALDAQESLDAAMANADAALYQAKLMGRSRVVVMEDR